jgi:hypothetical protein
MTAQGSRSLVSYQEETTWGVNPAGTAGTQEVSFTIGKAGGDATGLLNDETVYDASIAVDGGGAQLINVVGEEAQTFTALINQINQDLTGASIALAGGNLLVTSDTLGTSSAIAITDTDLFKLTLAQLKQQQQAQAVAQQASQHYRTLRSQST